MRKSYQIKFTKLLNLRELSFLYYTHHVYRTDMAELSPWD